MAQWAKLGIWFGSETACNSPDLENLLLDTAKLVPSNARLFYTCVSWLSQYGNLVEANRLKSLTEKRLATEHQPALAAILALAVKHGAPDDLLIVAETCHPSKTIRPLFDVHQQSKTLSGIAKTNACEECLKWNLWVQDQPPKLDVLRPMTWIIEQNPSFQARMKG